MRNIEQCFQQLIKHGNHLLLSEYVEGTTKLSQSSKEQKFVLATVTFFGKERKVALLENVWSCDCKQHVMLCGLCVCIIYAAYELRHIDYLKIDFDKPTDMFSRVIGKYFKTETLQLHFGGHAVSLPETDVVANRRRKKSTVKKYVNGSELVSPSSINISKLSQSFENALGNGRYHPDREDKVTLGNNIEIIEKHASKEPLFERKCSYCHSAGCDTRTCSLYLARLNGIVPLEHQRGGKIVLRRGFKDPVEDVLDVKPSSLEDVQVLQLGEPVTSINEEHNEMVTTAQDDNTVPDQQYTTDVQPTNESNEDIMQHRNNRDLLLGILSADFSEMFPDIKTNFRTSPMGPLEDIVTSKTPSLNAYQNYLQTKQECWFVDNLHDAAYLQHIFEDLYSKKPDDIGPLNNVVMLRQGYGEEIEFMGFTGPKEIVRWMAKWINVDYGQYQDDTNEYWPWVEEQVVLPILKSFKDSFPDMKVSAENTTKDGMSNLLTFTNEDMEDTIDFLRNV